jgi:hypothetical protein
VSRFEHPPIAVHYGTTKGSMMHTPDDDTVPPPTPGDALVSKVILFVGTIAMATVLGVIALAAMEVNIPQILEHTTTAAVTGLVALLAGRTQK